MPIMTRSDRRILKIALLFGMESKVNRDRFSGILRYAASKPTWEIRTSTANDIAAILGDPEIDRQSIWIPDGIILVGSGNIFSKYRAFCQRLARRDIPCAVIDGNGKRKPTGNQCDISTDNTKIAQAAAEYFMSKGFSNFAYMGTRDQSELPHSEARRRSFAETLKKSGFSCQTVRTIDPIRHKLLPIPVIAEDLKILPRPCALFAFSDEVARYILDACRYADISVPDSISVLGVDDQTEITENTRPMLSSILPDFEMSGYLAAKMLDSIMNKRATCRHVYTSSVIRVVERSSTQDIRGGGRIVRAACEYIRAHLSERIHTPDIAQRLNASPRLLEMRFRETLNCSIREKIISLRIEKAKELMLKGEMTFGQIAYACGYSTPVGLKVVFRKNIGQTMTDWLRQKKRNSTTPPA